MQDNDLRKTVIDELEFQPSIDAAHIGIAVDDGIVTLTGHVPTYYEKRTAERVVARIKGVRGIAQEIEVRPSGTHITADDEIAKRAANTLNWNTSIPKDAIKIKVTDGFVTLQGSVEWNYQRNTAETIVQTISGVTGISNQITIVSKATPSDVRQRIENALKRDAELDAKAISVKVVNGVVTLDGRVDCYADRVIAKRAAWAVPGVLQVEDHLHVS